MSRIRARLSFSNIVALLALFAALAGGALAAGSKFVGSNGDLQACIKKGALDVVKAGTSCPKHTSPLRIPINGNSAPTGAAGGSLTGTYPNPEIAAGVVRSKQLGAGSVGSTQLRAGAVGSTQLSAGAVGSTQLSSAALPEISTSVAGPVNFTGATLPGSQGILGIGTGSTGTFVANAKVVLSATAASIGLRAQAECTLELGNAVVDDGDWISPMVPVSSGDQAETTMSLEAPISVTPSSLSGTVNLFCSNSSSAGVTIQALSARIIVTRTTSNG